MLFEKRGVLRRLATHREQAACFLLCVALGCQGDVPSPTSSEMPHTLIPSMPEDAETKTAEALTVPTLEPLETGSVALNPEAVAAFDRLVSPNVSAEDWDTAQQALLDLGPEAASVLVSRLSDERPMVRELASTTLVLLGPEVTGPHEAVLVPSLNDESEFVRANVASALMLSSEHSALAVEALVGLLQSTDPGLRQLAAINLRSQPKAASAHLPALVVLLGREANVDVLIPLIELCGELGQQAESSAGELKRLATSGDAQISQSANAALIQIQGEIQQTQGESTFP